MNRLLRRLAALTACALLVLPGAPPVQAEEGVGLMEDISATDIHISVRMEEALSGTAVIPSLQLSCPAGTTAAGLLALLRSYSYLDSFRLANGVLCSVVLEENGVRQTVSGTDGWELSINGIPVDRGVLPVLKEGDEVCWTFVSAGDTSRKPPHEVAAASTAISWSERYAEALTQATTWLKNNFHDTTALVSLGVAGVSVEYQSIAQLIKTVSNGPDGTIVDLALLILSATFCGIPATNIHGKDLLDLLSSYPDLADEGPLAAACALIAADSNAYPLPEDGINTRSSLCQFLLSCQNADGGFPVEKGGASDPFLSAVSLTALSRYCQSEKVETALQKVLSYLTGIQNEDGSIPGMENVSTAMSTSFAIAALCAVGTLVDHSGFSDGSDGSSLLEALLTYQTQSGGFCPEPGEPAEEAATAAAILALTAVKTNRNIFVLNTPLLANSESAPPEEPEKANSPIAPAEKEPSSKEDIASDVAEESLPPLISIITAAGGLVLLAAAALLLWKKSRRRRRK